MYSHHNFVLSISSHITGSTAFRLVSLRPVRKTRAFQLHILQVNTRQIQRLMFGILGSVLKNSICNVDAQ